MMVKTTKDTQKAEHKLCPECGACMVVEDQCMESGAVSHGILVQETIAMDNGLRKRFWPVSRVPDSKVT